MRRGILCALTGLAIVAGLTSTAAVATSQAAVPVLGNGFHESKGYGHAEPSLLSSGGNAFTFEVTKISWEHWGEKRAVGHGTGWYVPPGNALLDGHKEAMKLVAFDLGSCHGRRAYRKLSWFFPAHGKHFDPDTANEVCHDY